MLNLVSGVGETAGTYLAEPHYYLEGAMLANDRRYLRGCSCDLVGGGTIVPAVVWTRVKVGGSR